MRERVRPGRGAIVRNFAGCRRRIERPLSDGAGWLPGAITRAEFDDDAPSGKE